MKQIRKGSIWILLILLCSCNDFLNVIPDNVATIDNAFAMRSKAMKYLFTCYSYMPKDGNTGYDPAMEGGDEMWRVIGRGGDYFKIAQGYQNKVSPYGDAYWTNMYKALRDCNIFLENIGKVSDIEATEALQWIAEVKFLKAYYHFYLVRMYGPIPLIKENLPITASVAESKVSRAPVDSCFNYIVQLLDEAKEDLPLTTVSKQDEAGRINKTIALSFKAKVLVTAASPLFNGNAAQASLKNNDGTPLFNTTYSKAKWDSAVVACKEAIDVCESAGLELFYYGSNYQQYPLTNIIQTQLSIRNSVCQRWNSEIIWANTQSWAPCAALALPISLRGTHVENSVPRGELSPPLKIAEQFYTKNGVPIDEDKTWDYNNRYNIRTGQTENNLYIMQGYATANLNFDREPRFYADLGFDGGIWYGQGVYDDTNPAALFVLKAKFGQVDARQTDRSTVTGYFIKKLINFENVLGATYAYSQVSYPVPIMRLSDLYLLYAEALNESEEVPSDEAYKYINLVRQRAALPTVQDAWGNYSLKPDKYKTKNGFREIIHQERNIELAFESQRFWDLRRWKEATKVMNAPIQGWDGFQSTESFYYRPSTIIFQKFGEKDYFWPIEDSNITTNRNLVQNIGW